MGNKMTKTESIKMPTTFKGLVKYTKEVIKNTNFVFENMPGEPLTGFSLKIINKKKMLVGCIYFYATGSIFLAGFGFSLKRTIPQMIKLIDSLVEK